MGGDDAALGLCACEGCFGIDAAIDVGCVVEDLVRLSICNGL